MAENIKKFVDSEGLLYVCQLIANQMKDKVNVVAGKELSSNDFTNELKEKLLNINLDDSFTNEYKTQLSQAYTAKHTHENKAVLDTITEAFIEAWNKAEENAINAVKVNGATANIDPEDKSVNITVPTAEDVETSIAEAIAGIVGIKFEVVDSSLPETGVDGTIYLVAAEGTGQNIYNEFVWVGDKYEQLGTTEAKFNRYWSKEELTVATNQEIDEIFNTAFGE